VCTTDTATLFRSLPAREAVTVVAPAVAACTGLATPVAGKAGSTLLATVPRHPGAIGAASTGAPRVWPALARTARAMSAFAHIARTICALFAASCAAAAGFSGLAGEGSLAHGGLRDAVSPTAAALARLLAVARRTIG